MRDELRDFVAFQLLALLQCAAAINLLAQKHHHHHHSSKQAGSKNAMAIGRIHLLHTPSVVIVGCGNAAAAVKLMIPN